MTLRVFTTESMSPMTDRTYATQANAMAAGSRVRVFGSCMATPAAAVWSPIPLGAYTHKQHGRPRRLEVSHP